eukprot:8622047-Pyramimonas_sp.AAC.1
MALARGVTFLPPRHFFPHFYGQGRGVQSRNRESYRGSEPPTRRPRQLSRQGKSQKLKLFITYIGLPLETEPLWL